MTVSVIPIPLTYQYRTGPRQTACIAIAAAVHAAILFWWNPVILHGSFTQITNPLVEIGLIEENAPPIVEPPKKMSLLDTLKDMLRTPEPVAPHIAPQAAPKPLAPNQPSLQERVMPRLINALKPKDQVDDLAMAKNPALINTPKKSFTVPENTPSLQAKSFSGIRKSDLPFQVNPDENLSQGTQAVPISVGNRSAKAALTYVNPSLRDASNSRVSLQGRKFVGSTAMEPGVSAAPSSIQLAAPGTAGTAPTGSSAGALQDRQNAGGGLINRALLGNGRASTVTSLQTMPNSAAQLDQQLALTEQSNASRKKLNKGFEIAGKLENRPIKKKVIPQYPSWAEEQGIIGTLRLYFTVTPEGVVRNNIKVTKTTGNQQLDQIGIDALKQWLFAPQPNGNDDDVQWGIITFTFSLAS